jgi:hypothetical protein
MLDRLAIVADPSQTEAVRMVALAGLVACLPVSHPYRSEPLGRLYDRLKQPWHSRLYLENGHAVERLVSRPPVSLADIL